MYHLQWFERGRVHYVNSEQYDTLVILFELLSVKERAYEIGELAIWQGMVKKRANAASQTGV